MTILVLSNTANPHFYSLLEKCVTSAIKHSVVIVETNSKLINKKIPLAEDNKNVKFVFPQEEFNYNRFLNLGLNTITDNKIIITNNDVEFLPGCIDEINSKLSTYDSVSPYDLYNSKHNSILGPCIEGYDIGVHITGCCIGVTRTALNKIGPFDESFKFWYQDNDYANLLKKHNLRHALLRDAKIKHYGQQSHVLLGDKHLSMTHGLETVYKEKWFE